MLPETPRRMKKSGGRRTLVRRGFEMVQQALSCVTRAKEPPKHPNTRRVLGCPSWARECSQSSPGALESSVQSWEENFLNYCWLKELKGATAKVILNAKFFLNPVPCKALLMVGRSFTSISVPPLLAVLEAGLYHILQVEGTLLEKAPSSSSIFILGTG